MMKFDDEMSGAGVVIEDERRRGLKRKGPA
jgi:hypothetical protein